jgi:NDP-sugar pyrophosphorylase family protein
MKAPTKAMVLAAGLGTRLRPLTNERPKALVEVAGRTLLDLTLARLRTLQIREIIVNVHHFADQIVDYLRAHQNFGMRIELSRENELLDTGGGLKKASWFFTETAADTNRPFLLHNVDVLCAIDLAAMARFHAEHNALATLAVQHRPTTRYLLFNDRGHLIARYKPLSTEADAKGTGFSPYIEPTELTGALAPGETLRPLAFNGIHILSPAIFPKLTETGPFSIIEAYIRLAKGGEIIQAFEITNAYWRDLGHPEDIVQATEDIATRIYPPEL